MSFLKLLSVFFILNSSFAETYSLPPINKECPISGKKIDPVQFLTYGVCCANCLKKASSNLKEFIKITKPNNRVCSLSAKPIKKNLTIGFCCYKCKKKASS